MSEAEAFGAKMRKALAQRQKQQAEDRRFGCTESSCDEESQHVVGHQIKHNSQGVKKFEKFKMSSNSASGRGSNNYLASTTGFEGPMSSFDSSAIAIWKLIDDFQFVCHF